MHESTKLRRHRTTLTRNIVAYQSAADEAAEWARIARNRREVYAGYYRWLAKKQARKETPPCT